MEMIEQLKHLQTNVNENELDKCHSTTSRFISENEKLFKFENIKTTEQLKVLEQIYKILNMDVSTMDNVLKPKYEDLCLQCLTITRILSRDKNLVLKMITIDKLVQKFLSLYKDNNEFYKIEILKCLCNLIYHSQSVRKFFIENKIASTVLREIEIHIAVDDILFYSIRVIFLMSALESSERASMIEQNSVEILTQVLEKGLDLDLLNTSTSQNTKNLMSEVLKALFNIALELSHVSSESTARECSLLASTLRKLILKYTPFTTEQSKELLTDIAHMLVNIPKEAMGSLLGDVDGAASIQEESSEEKRMDVINILLRALDERMKIPTYIQMKNNSMAILTAFSYVCRINPEIRKYLRKTILPSFKPSEIRPEDEDNITGRIIKLMTTVDVPLKNMAADFLFVLCKEKTSRLIRYAGYGNSAGFLASRGLMIPGMASTEGIYSEDELSDADDDDVNIMTGVRNKTPAFDINSLTEEEKEIEAQKLMCMIDRLHELNIIKPMKVGEDGKLTEMNPSAANEDDSDID